MIFVENMTEDDLIDMKIKKSGHRQKILREIKSYTKKQQESCSPSFGPRKNNSISQTINISKSMGALRKFKKKGGKNKTRQKHAKSAHRAHHIKQEDDINQVPSTSRLTHQKTFDSSELYLSNDGDCDSLYDDQESKDGDKKTGDSSDFIHSSIKSERHKNSMIAIRGSDDDDDMRILKFDPKQNRRSRTRKRYRANRNSSHDSTTSLSSVTSSNLSFDLNNNNGNNNNNNDDYTRQNTFDSQTTFTIKGQFSPSASPSSLAPSSSSTMLHHTMNQSIHQNSIHHQSIHQQSIHHHHPIIHHQMSSASIQSAMKAAYSTCDGPPNDTNDEYKRNISNRDTMMSDIDYAVLDINEIAEHPHKSSVSSSMSGIWDSPRHTNRKSQIEISKTNVNSAEGASPTEQLSK